MHRDGHQALDQIHDRVGAALLAQEVTRVVDDARRLVRLHVVAVDDPLVRPGVGRGWCVLVEDVSHVLGAVVGDFDTNCVPHLP